MAAVSSPAQFDWIERDRSEYLDGQDRGAGSDRPALKPIDATIAEEAVAVVKGPRQDNYAHPIINFQRIADLWGPVFGHAVTPQQVSLAMILVKVAREINMHTRDNLVDLIGYTLTLDAVSD